MKFITENAGVIRCFLLSLLGVGVASMPGTLSEQAPIIGLCLLAYVIGAWQGYDLPRE